MYYAAILATILTTLYLFGQIEHYSKLRDKIDAKLVTILSRKDSNFVDDKSEYLLGDDYKTFEPNQWVFNFNVTQFSNIIVRNSYNQFDIEALVLFDNSKTDSSMIKHILFYVKYEKGKYFSCKTNKMTRVKSSLWKLTCRLKEKLDYSRAYVAVVDHQYFNYYSKLFNNSKYLLSFQKPSLFNKSSELKKGIANCMYFIFDYLCFILNY
jgi:hypothetical protein